MLIQGGVSRGFSVSVSCSPPHPLLLPLLLLQVLGAAA
jgi:hypothetical protein